MELQSERSEGIGGCSGSDYGLAYHPLMNAEILSNIFANFTIDECDSLRLVNKTWHDELQHRWMNETVVQVSHAQLPLDYDSGTDTDDVRSQNLQVSNCNCPHGCMSIDYFLHQLAHPSSGRRLFDGKPILNLETCFECVSDERISFGHPDSAMYKFWNICGQSLKYLHLCGVKFSTRRDARKLLFELTPNLENFKFTSSTCVSIPIYVEPTSFRPLAFTQPNLKSVYIELVEQKFPISWMTFFSHFPRIEKFELTTRSWDSIGTDLSNVIDALCTIRQSMGNQVLNWTDFDLNNYAINENVRWTFDDLSATKLCSLQLPLSNLRLGWLDFNKDALAKILNSHRATLQSLDVTVREPIGSFLFAIPYQAPLEKLKKLQLRGRVFPTWEFLKYTPNLEKLVVYRTSRYCSQMSIPPSDVFTQGRVPVLTRVSKLIYSTEDMVPAETVKFLIKAMPNVTKLEMNVDLHWDTMGFKEICKGWKLREWAALSCMVDDDVFVKHITLLSSLSTLQFFRCNANDTNDPGFGERAIHEGFLKLRNLSNLYAHFSPQVSSSSIELLKSRISDVYVYYTTST